MINLNNVIEQNINLSTNVVNKLNVGFVFGNKDYCRLVSINVLQHTIKMLDQLNLTEENKKQINFMFNKLIND